MRWCARRNSRVRLDARMPSVAISLGKHAAPRMSSRPRREVTHIQTTHEVDAVFRDARKKELIDGIDGLKKAIPSLAAVTGWNTSLTLLDIVGDYVQNHEITITIEVTSETLRKQAHIECGMWRLVVAPTSSICEVIYTFLHVDDKDLIIFARDVNTESEFDLVPEPSRQAKDLVMHSVCNNVHLQLAVKATLNKTKTRRRKQQK